MSIDFHIRPIELRDNAQMAQIIRLVMPEFGADGPGFAIHDPEVDRMASAYAEAQHAYFVIERDGKVEGGGGIAPLINADDDICELRKMYFLPSLRGLGAGRVLMQQCLQSARAAGFRGCYLETLSGMDRAQSLYEQSGFQRIDNRMGGTGHFGCNRFYLLDL